MRVATPPTDDTAEVELVTRLRLAVGRLNRQFRQASAGGLSPSQLSALASVDKLGPVRLADLAAYEGVAPPTLTRIAAGLVELGLLERHSNPDDARSALVSCTAEGRRTMRQVRAERTAILVQRIGGLPAAQRKKLADAVAFLDALVDEDRRPA
jgi:DNA-binding MarR family transcriptional regulator